MATAQPSPACCRAMTGWVSEDGGMGAAGLLCTVQRWASLGGGTGSTQHIQGRGQSSGEGTRVGAGSWHPLYHWCQGTSPVPALFRSPAARSSWGVGCEGASRAAAGHRFHNPGCPAGGRGGEQTAGEDPQPGAACHPVSSQGKPGLSPRSLLHAREALKHLPWKWGDPGSSGSIGRC